MPGPTTCPFCRSPKIHARLPVQGLHEYECADCERTWLVARQKRQAKVETVAAGTPEPRRAGGKS